MVLALVSASCAAVDASCVTNYYQYFREKGSVRYTLRKAFTLVNVLPAKSIDINPFFLSLILTEAEKIFRFVS